MKRNPNYILKEISGIPYLHPFGQMIENRMPALKLNETGVLVWNILQNDCSFDSLVKKCAAHYNITQLSDSGIISNDYTQLEHDLKDFCGRLIDLGIIYVTKAAYLFIAGLSIKVTGDISLLSSDFDNFRVESSESLDYTISLLPCESNSLSIQNLIHHKPVISSGELNIYEDKTDYILHFPASATISYATISKIKNESHYYYTAMTADELKEELFHALRLSFLFLAQTKNMMVLHSSSFLYREKAWLFSGPSGIGKSTHTNIWANLFPEDICLLNGDLNLIGLNGIKPVIHGIPWCGTSGIYDTCTHPLGGIILLKQDSKNYIKELSNEEKQLRILHRLVSPAWNADMLTKNLCFTEKLFSKIIVCELHCTKEDEAALTMKKYIDRLY